MRYGCQFIAIHPFHHHGLALQMSKGKTQALGKLCSAHECSYPVQPHSYPSAHPQDSNAALQSQSASWSQMATHLES